VEDHRSYPPEAPRSEGPTFADFARDHPGPGRPVDGDPVETSRGRVKQGWVATPEPQFEPAPDAPGQAPFRPALTGTGLTFSVDRFARNLRQRLEGNCTGWAFVINVNGQEARSDHDGTAITPGDQDEDGDTIGKRDMTPDTRVNIASLSKTITAVAVLRLLRANNLGTAAPIWPFLPADWTLGPKLESLRFHHLLTHSSGLHGVLVNDVSDEGLRLTLALGADPGAPYKYLNANFALFRVIIPALWNRAGLEAANNDHPVASAFFYAVYIIEEMLKRMGDAVGADASTSILEAVPARYYLNSGSALGLTFGNWALVSGGGGWHMTARELAAFLAHITYNDDMLPPDLRAGMDQLRYGWRPPSFFPGSFGPYWGSGGYLKRDFDGRQGRLRTGIMKFSTQVEASLVANSFIAAGAGESDWPPEILRRAYDAAWQ